MVYSFRVARPPSLPSSCFLKAGCLLWTSITPPSAPLNIGPCVGERCNFWDPEQGCIGVGLCFDAEPSGEYAQPELFGEDVLLSCYEDPD